MTMYLFALDSYFACLGYFLDGSGGMQILSNADVLAQGSLNGFLTGKFK